MLIKVGVDINLGNGCEIFFVVVCWSRDLNVIEWLVKVGINIY